LNIIRSFILDGPIATAPADANDRPNQPTKITKVTIEEKAAAK